MSELLDNYDTAEDTLRKLYDSKLRMSILDALSKGPMRLADLRREVNSNAPNVSAKAKDLEAIGLVERVSGDYRLTQLGKVVRDGMTGHLAFYATLEKYKDYWLSRRLDFIPDALWADIGLLRDSEVVKSSQMNTTFTHDKFVELLHSIKKTFRGISPIYHKDYVDALKGMAARGVDVELIVTPQVLQEIMGKLSDEEKKALATYPKIKVYLCEGFDSGVTVSESFVNLCIVSKTDVVSLMDQYFHSEGPGAVRWGNKLFDYYKAKSTKVELR